MEFSSRRNVRSIKSSAILSKDGMERENGTKKKKINMRTPRRCRRQRRRPRNDELETENKEERRNR